MALSAIAMAAVLTLAPATLRAETLAEALATAVTNSPDLDVQRAALRGLDEAVAQARAGYRPTVTGQASVGASYGRSSETDKSDTDIPLSVGATVTQSIYDGGQTSNAVDGALASVKSGRFALQATEQDVLLDGVTAYAGVLEAQQRVSLAENNLGLTRRTLKATRDRFEVGEVTRTDTAQAEASVAEARANLSTQQGLLGQQRQAYIRAVGVAPGALAPLPPLPALPQTFEEAIATAEQNHPSVLAAKANVEAASFAVREAIGATMPQVDLAGTVQGARNSKPGREAFDSSATLSVTVPFYQGGALSSAVRQAQASANQSRAQLGVTTRTVMQQVGVAWETLQSARASIDANRAQVRAQQIAYDGVLEEAKVGSRTTLDVVDAEQDLFNARVALVTAETDLFTSAYGLLSAMGVLTVAKLDLSVAEYDYETPHEQSQGWFVDYESTPDTEWQKNWRP